MEGYPLYGDDGLEYLFGVWYRQRGHGRYVFKAFWAHDRAQEKHAFESFMDWLEARWRALPMRVYHYAAYEDTALKKLAARHATREAFLDRLLREKRLVDLYRVTRESIRASTASYSIKDIETFYRGKRSGDVQTAGASIVYYERYLETGDKALLEKIERYNQDDVESTQQLHDWLWSMFPDRHSAQRRHGRHDCGGIAAALQPALAEAAGVPRPGRCRAQRVACEAVRGATVMADLLEFHRRQEKPQWWEMLARTELTFDDLLESVDAIAGLARVPGTAVDEYETRRRRSSSTRTTTSSGSNAPTA